MLISFPGDDLTPSEYLAKYGERIEAKAREAAAKDNGDEPKS